MDSTPAACAASPEWHWFWFWFDVLVLVNVATEIALCTIAVTTRHLLVCMTSLGHHIIIKVKKNYRFKYKFSYKIISKKSSKKKYIKILKYFKYIYLIYINSFLFKIYKIRIVKY